MKNVPSRLPYKQPLNATYIRMVFRWVENNFRILLFFRCLMNNFQHLMMMMNCKHFLKLCFTGPWNPRVSFKHREIHRRRTASNVAQTWHQFSAHSFRGKPRGIDVHVSGLASLNRRDLTKKKVGDEMVPCTYSTYTMTTNILWVNQVSRRFFYKLMEILWIGHAVERDQSLTKNCNILLHIHLWPGVHIYICMGMKIDDKITSLPQYKSDSYLLWWVSRIVMFHIRLRWRCWGVLRCVSC